MGSLQRYIIIINGDYITDHGVVLVHLHVNRGGGGGEQPGLRGQCSVMELRGVDYCSAAPFLTMQCQKFVVSFLTIEKKKTRLTVTVHRHNSICSPFSVELLGASLKQFFFIKSYIITVLILFVERFV